MVQETTSLTDLLRGLTDGGQTAEKVQAKMYDELKLIAERLMRGERPDHTLGATGLLHETLLRLGQPNGLDGIENTRDLLAGNDKPDAKSVD